MNLQVNLLKKAERRYQGIVSMKAMVLGSVGLLLSISIIGFMLAGISKVTLDNSLARARQEWKQLEPQVIQARSAEAAAAANRKMLTELENWAKGDHPSMHIILRSMQKQIPAQMTLENLYAGIEQNMDVQAYTLRFSGRAQGELTAVDAKRQLNANEDVRGFCGEVKLVSSQRGNTGDSWMFSLEGRRPVGGTK